MTDPDNGSTESAEASVKADETAEFAGLWAVASELCRRGWRVGPTLGNTKAYDLLAAWPLTGKTITVDVKAKWRTRADGRLTAHHWPCSNLLNGAERTRSSHYVVFVNVNRGDRVLHDYYVVPGRVAIERLRKNVEIGLRKTQSKMAQFRIFDSPREDPDSQHVRDFEGWGALAPSIKARALEYGQRMREAEPR
jgi:hypothetical protein